MKVDPKLPLVSVLTTVKNGAKTIGVTLNSVISQDHINIEYIIIDGGSTDDTVNIIRSCSDKRIRFYIEKDKGVYYGMNNAIAKANGDVIAILNSGDYYYDDNVITKICHIYQEVSNKNIVINGGILLLNERGNILKEIVRKTSDMAYKHLLMPINHPAFFVSKSIYEKYGNFNTNFRIGADYEFVLRLLQNKVNFVFIRDICTVVSPLGLSSYNNNIFLALNEQYAIRSLYTNLLFNKCLYFVGYMLFVRRWIKSKTWGS